MHGERATIANRSVCGRSSEVSSGITDRVTQPALSLPPFAPRAFPTTNEVFGVHGLFETLVPGYVARAGQLQMTEVVEDAYVNRRKLLVEGPTGTGKSLAYLVPAIRAYAERATRTIVVTSNIALQEQLCRKDLPALVRSLRRPFRFAMLKGVSNYLCREALDDSLLDPGSPLEVRDLASWAQRTIAGDLSELDHELAPRTRQLVTTSSEECLGTKCPSYDKCFMVRARLDARAAHVVVVNYHLFFADLALRAEGHNGILPDHEAVILDELHNAASIARSFFGRKLTFGGVQHVVRRLLNVNPSLAKELEGVSQLFFEGLERHRNSDDYRARLQRPDVAYHEDVRHALRQGAKAIRESLEGEIDQAVIKKLSAAADGADRHAAFILAAMSLAEPETTVYSLEPPEGQKSCSLVGQPIDVAPMLREHLWETDRLGTVIGTSATLGDGRSLNLVAQEVGADAAIQVEVPSPFDWPRQAVVVVPPGLPLPKAKEWPDAVCEALLAAIRAAQGRTLALFTSRRMLEHARRIVLAANLPYRVMVQGDAPRTKLVEQFREDTSSVLLGTKSLWEGVDVQGEALSCVVIDKLPFESPDDPVASMLSERRRDYFQRVALPRAVLEFRQGAGRLIRTSTDRGVIVVLDDRIVSKPYGRKFIKGLPDGVRVLRGSDWSDEVRRFLG